MGPTPTVGVGVVQLSRCSTQGRSRTDRKDPLIGADGVEGLDALFYRAPELTGTISDKERDQRNRYRCKL